MMNLVPRLTPPEAPPGGLKETRSAPRRRHLSLPKAIRPPTRRKTAGTWAEWKGSCAEPASFKSKERLGNRAGSRR